MRSYVACAIAALACSDSAPQPRDGTIAILAGNEQAAEIGQPLAESLAVVARSHDDRPVPGITVVWTVADNGGTVSPSSSVTNAAGIARTLRTLSQSVGPHGTTATAAALASAQPVSFTATARLEGGVTLGDRTIGPLTDTTLGTNDQPLVVMVVNEKNEPVPGVVVHWTAGPGGTLSATEMPTDAGGESIVTYTYGPVVGEFVVTASKPGLLGSPIEFTMRATAGNPVAIEKSGGDGLTLPAGSQVIYTLTSRDARGNAANGVRIVWEVGSGGGSVTPGQNFTGGNGTATATRTLGPSAGAHTVVATAPDLPGSPSVTFSTTVP